MMQNDENVFIRPIDIDHERTLKIFQELESDVGGVVWDSALVAVHYFIKNPEKYRKKRVAFSIYFPYLFSHLKFTSVIFSTAHPKN
ncbi:hypothetical protein GCK32_012926 [Trichostrongylus colubriformis]|uniref:Uncharacterized protein n=1 Tax=Trichostrongylus colubriformis TaxID=6319 RepID=A0AAN8IH43_TRICO